MFVCPSQVDTLLVARSIVVWGTLEIGTQAAPIPSGVTAGVRFWGDEKSQTVVVTEGCATAPVVTCLRCVVVVLRGRSDPLLLAQAVREQQGAGSHGHPARGGHCCWRKAQSMDEACRHSG